MQNKLELYDYKLIFNIALYIAYEHTILNIKKINQTATFFN